MDYHCEVCNMFIKPNGKSKHFKSKNHKNLNKHKLIKLTIDNSNINNIDETFNGHINEYNNNHEYYLVRCEFKLCFIIMEDYGFALSEITDNKTIISRKIFV